MSRIPTSLRLVNASIRPASVCIYARLAGGGGRGGEARAARGKPLCDIIPHARSPGRFVSLADFCRLTPKHPWTLPPPFTFNLYQSIQPRPNRTHERACTRDATMCGRHRALFTADSAFTLATSVHLFHRVSPSPPPPVPPVSLSWLPELRTLNISSSSTCVSRMNGLSRRLTRYFHDFCRLLFHLFELIIIN